MVSSGVSWVCTLFNGDIPTPTRHSGVAGGNSVPARPPERSRSTQLRKSAPMPSIAYVRYSSGREHVVDVLSEAERVMFASIHETKKCQALARSPFNLHDAPCLLMQSRRQVTALSYHDVLFGLLTAPYRITPIRRLGFPTNNLTFSSWTVSSQVQNARLVV